MDRRILAAVDSDRHSRFRSESVFKSLPRMSPKVMQSSSLPAGGKRLRDSLSGSDGDRAPKKRSKSYAPREGGTMGEFERFIERAREKKAPGIDTPLILGQGPDGRIVQLAASCDREQYSCIDLRHLSFSEQDGPRDLAAVQTLFSRITSHIEFSKGGLSDLGRYKGWKRQLKGPEDENIYDFPCPRLYQKLEYSTLKYSEGCLAGLVQLRLPFCDNIIVMVSAGGGKTAFDVTFELCNAMGWQAGRNAEECDHKYYVTRARKQTSAERLTGGDKIKISTADIPIAEVFAARDLIRTAICPDNRKTLLDEHSSHFTIGLLLDTLRKTHPESTLFRGLSGFSGDLIRALKTAAQHVICFVDIDVSQDEPGTGNYPALEGLLKDEGYEIADSKIGINALRTCMKKDGNRSFSILVYAKEIETIQQPGISTGNSLDSKVHRLVRASTAGLRARFAHPAYQKNGCTRIELKFAGEWEVEEMLKLCGQAKALVQRALASKSIHDHFLDAEVHLNRTVAVFIPAVHDFKTQFLRRIAKKARKQNKKLVNSVYEGVVVHYKTSTTGKKVGRPVATPVNLVKGSDGFDLFVRCLAFESPCNTPITLILVVDGFDEFMSGTSPLLWVRTATVEKVCDDIGQERMLVSHRVCKGLGPHCPEDVLSACGVRVDELGRFKIAVSAKDPDYASTRMWIKVEGCPAQSEKIQFPARTYVGKESVSTLPSSFTPVRISEDRRGKMGRPSLKSVMPLVFQYLDDYIRIPEQHQEEIRSWRDQQPDKDNCILLARAVDSGFEFQFPTSTEWIHGTARKDSDIPVKDTPMKILAIHRRKYGRGACFEIDLEGEGRFRAPVTTAKHFVAYLRKTKGVLQDTWLKGFSHMEPSTIDLSDFGYYLEHKCRQRGRVSGGKGDEEEFIGILKLGSDSKYQFCLGSVPT